ncbi:DUF3581 domain-containing protein [Vibrio hepatarius]|uniref:DUF3581 domain-containing protein n=1 Tax=Vibrio hepatarius TaxID=171383 RepID=UPI001C08B967|nr:DUF3581 domain-containing protein [Vibrio hepatarius]MBU2897739.1 DUF3581 domain-containing protein [Vibrio hepatarius]
MFLKPYFSSNDKKFEFTRQQASYFAKLVAGDFNPIHDEDNKRFCIPGDLLFAVLLKKEGVSQRMRFDFSGMVGDGIALHIENKCDKQASVVDCNGKEYLQMTREGEINNDPAFIEHIVTSYVKFSGMNFPHIMVPLMLEQQMMINCQRPLVIYESMEVEFTRLDISNPEVEFNGASFYVEGKRGLVTLNFDFKQGSDVVGNGIKRMVASGLRQYHQDDIDDLVTRFNERKKSFLAQMNKAA